jgi:hypothetical protein
MSDGPVWRLCWRAVDHLDYALTLARLRILDVLTGPQPRRPKTSRGSGIENQLEKAFPEIKP